MPQGKAIIEDVQWIVIRLSATMSPEDIAAYTNLSERKVRGIISHFNRTGDVKVPTCERPRLQRSLQDEDIKVCEFVSSSYPTDLYKHLFDTLSCMPDLYLDELWLELQQTSGVDVSISTIWRTLVKGGFSMKKVSGMLMPMAETYIAQQLTRTAIERSAEKRANFAARIGTYEANQLVFVDESTVDRRTTYRGRAWAIWGHKATRKCFFCRGKR